MRRETTRNRGRGLCLLREKLKIRTETIDRGVVVVAGGPLFGGGTRAIYIRARK